MPRRGSRAGSMECARTTSEARTSRKALPSAPSTIAASCVHLQSSRVCACANCLTQTVWQDHNFCVRLFKDDTLSWSEVLCACPPDLPYGDGVGPSGCSAPSCSKTRARSRWTAAGRARGASWSVRKGGWSTRMRATRTSMSGVDGADSKCRGRRRSSRVWRRAARTSPSSPRRSAVSSFLSEPFDRCWRAVMWNHGEEAAFLWNTFGRVWLGLCRDGGPFEGRTDAWKWEDGTVLGAGTVQVITGAEVAVSNSGMEDDSVSDASVGWESRIISSWSSSGDTYLVSQDNIVWGGLNSGDGEHFVALRSWYGVGARMEQAVVGLTVGAQYVVRFKAAARPFFGETPILTVNVTDSDGNVLVEAWMVGEQEDWRRYPGAYAPLHARFEEFSVMFTAVEARATIKFDTDMSKRVGDRAAFVDQISVAEVASIKTTWSPMAGVELEAESGACVALAGATGLEAVECEAAAGVVCEMPR
eukprot:1114782-Rhodomonas_salina.1